MTMKDDDEEFANVVRSGASHSVNVSEYTGNAKTPKNIVKSGEDAGEIAPRNAVDPAATPSGRAREAKERERPPETRKVPAPLPEDTSVTARDETLKGKPNVQTVAPADAGAPNRQQAAAANPDLNLQRVESAHGRVENGQNGQDGALQDNRQGFATDKLQDNHQGLGQEALHDNRQGLAADKLQDNHQGLGQEALEDHRQALLADPLADNAQDTGHDALHDNRQGLGQDSFADNHQSLGQDTLHDNRQGIGPAAGFDATSGPPAGSPSASHLSPAQGQTSASNLQGVDGAPLGTLAEGPATPKALTDHHVGEASALESHDATAAKVALQDNLQKAPQPAPLEDNTPGVAKKVLTDHLETLPDTRVERTAPVLPGAASPNAPPASPARAGKRAAARASAAPTAPAAPAPAHRPAMSMEDFHGRLAGIKHNVDALNDRLSDLEAEMQRHPGPSAKPGKRGL